MKKNQNISSSVLMPSRESAENAIIGACLIESTAIDEVADILTSEMFYNPANAILFLAISDLYAEGRKPDMITVMQMLMNKGQLDEIGGAYALSQLTGNVASAINIREYAMIVHQCFLSRQLIVASYEIGNKANDPQYDITDTIDEALKKIENIADGTCFSSQIRTVSESAKEALELYGQRKMAANQGEKSGVDTGIRDLNVITNGGWKPGNLIVLAARPAMGKTALMLHLAKSAALAGTPVLIFSLEMDAQGLTNRLLMSESNINSYRFSSGKLVDKEEADLSNAYDRIYGLPISIDDTAGISIHQIKSRARNEKRKGKCKLVLIDYLQLIDMRQQNKTYNREQEVSQTSRAAKIMAKELGVPVILLSQLSRNVENRGDKIPMLSDLRESGAIEQDADIVIFIHRPEYYDEKAEKGVGVLRIAKQRDGAVGDVAFKYNHNLTKLAGFKNNEKMPF